MATGLASSESTDQDSRSDYVSPQELPITQTDGTSIIGISNVLDADIVATNGIIHILDTIDTGIS